MLELALTSFATFFATIGPIEAAVLFATLTPSASRAERASMAVRATLIASAVLAAFVVLGQPVLKQLGVSIPALRTAGGIVLLIIALDMIFARPDSSFRLTPPEGAEAQSKEDIVVFPLATPLLAGPGAMSSAILLAASANGEALLVGAVLGALAATMVLTLMLLLAAHELNKVIGVTAQRVLMRVFGILLAAIAVQAAFDGIAQSGLVRR